MTGRGGRGIAWWGVVWAFWDGACATAFHHLCLPTHPHRLSLPLPCCALRLPLPLPPNLFVVYAWRCHLSGGRRCFILPQPVHSAVVALKASPPGLISWWEFLLNVGPRGGLLAAASLALWLCFVACIWRTVVVGRLCRELACCRHLLDRQVLCTNGHAQHACAPSCIPCAGCWRRMITDRRLKDVWRVYS